MPSTPSNPGAVPALDIRPATDQDWPAIWPFWHEIVAAADTYAYDPATTYDQARSGWLAPPPDEAWVAQRDGVLLGTYHLAPNLTR